MSEVVGGHQQRAYAVGGFLKNGHAATMHGILILPVLAWLLSYTGRPERDRVRIMILGTAGYALFAVAVIAESLTGAAVVAFGVAGLGALVLIAAGLITLAALVRRPARPLRSGLRSGAERRPEGPRRRTAAGTPERGRPFHAVPVQPRLDRAPCPRLPCTG